MEVASGVFLVSSIDRLAYLVDKLQGFDTVAVDMEADSLHHYFEKVCLIQLSLDGEHFLIDPLSNIDLMPFMQELAKRRIILHGADYDLRMLRRDFGFEPREIFDTVSAAQLLGIRQFGLAALVERYCGVLLSKRGQKADWSRRPLPQDLLDYAADDTRYLNTLMDALTDELRTANRLDWHREVCRNIMAAAANHKDRQDPERAWRIKGWHTLKSPRAKAILKSLWEWRERQAQQQDVPPFRVISNETLVSLAAWGELNQDWALAPRLPRNCVGERLRALKRAMTRGRQAPLVGLTLNSNGPRQASRPVNEPLLNTLRRLRDAKAGELNLEPSLLAPAAALSAIARSFPTNAEELRQGANLYHWQAEVLADSFLEALQSVRSRVPKTVEQT